MLCKTTFTPEGDHSKNDTFAPLPSLESCSKEQLLNKKNCVMFLRDHALQTSTPYCHFSLFPLCSFCQWFFCVTSFGFVLQHLLGLGEIMCVAKGISTIIEVWVFRYCCRSVVLFVTLMKSSL